MNRTFLCYFLSICLSACLTTKKNTEKQELQNNLFIGNSLTYYNDMPQTLQKMLDSQHINISVTQCTYQGISLDQHLSKKAKIAADGMTNLTPLEKGDSSNAVKLLFAKKWIFIILQTGTVQLLIPEARNAFVVPAVTGFMHHLKTSSTDFILFKTWPNLDTFPQQSCYPSVIIDRSLTKDKCCSSVFNSYSQECDYIDHAYDSVADIIKIKTVPVTNCYKYMYIHYPTINPYKDEVHPSEIGSYLNACVFFKQLTKKKASTIHYYAGIDPTTAKIVQQLVDVSFK